ncbi:MAG TPA: Ig-like domain-containing protein [Polyangiaceae bacterium LLY-WYZ-15_(1-7)]|nr:Ig-like domain-containing protein [Polyangiaceae bacterium LLY-WYZ-15_(1-7)]
MHERPLPTSRLALALAAAAALVACDGSEGPVFDEDAGTDAGPALDGGPSDVVAPRVVGTSPADGEEDVALDATVVVTFDEPMDTGRGEVRFPTVARALAPSASWNAEGTELRVSVAGWPEGATVSAALEGFADLAGNPLRVYRWSFTTAAVPPIVASSSPAEGDAGLSARIDTIELVFSEPMDNTAGSVAFADDVATVDGIAWVDGATLRVDVSGLAYETSYTLTLDGFVDRTGNPLDGEPTLGDGALDFATGVDEDGPRVTDADPSEGQLDVVTARVETITVLFDEDMDTSVGAGELSIDGEDGPVALPASWADAREVRFDVAGRLLTGREHHLALVGFTDVAGNALDGEPFLGDGALDFETGRDFIVPFVGFSDPLEGADDVSFRRDEVRIVFNEAMDTSRTELTFEDDLGASFSASGVWSLAGTTLTVPVAGQLASGRSYTVDLTAFRDLGGAALDAAHPYLGDGALDFALGAPTGERCNDALTLDQAVVEDGVATWTLSADQAQTYDGSTPCDVGERSTDAVIRYTKTSEGSAGGGTLLHVVVQGGGANLDVYQDVCDPLSIAAETAQLKCLWFGDDEWDAYLDVGPGDYYLWISDGGATLDDGVVVTVEEVDAAPEGETCADPWDATSPNYTPPAAPGDPGIWVFAEEAFRSFDRDVTWGGEGTMPCDADYSGGPIHGPDGVIEVQKSSGSSILQIDVQVTGNASADELNVELLDRCDPLAPDARSLACEANIEENDNPTQLFHEGPAGSYYVWLATARTNGVNDITGVAAREIEPGPGDTCTTAIPIGVDATNAVTPAGTERLFAPSCAPAGESLTWYRFTTTEALSRVSTDVAAAVGLVDAASGAERGCGEDALAQEVAAFVPAGTELCVAVPSGAGIGAITVEAVPYQGVGGTLTPLSIDRPFDAGGSEDSITSDYWMAVTPTTLYMGLGTNDVMRAPKVGSVRAELVSDMLGDDQLGHDGVAIGEAIFVLDEDDRPAGEPRIHRIVNGAGTFGITAWDAGSSYVEEDMDAMGFDGTDFVVATDIGSSSDPTVFYAVDPTAPSSARLLGSNTALEDVLDIAADATWVYVVGNTGTTSSEGVYRLRRSDLGDPGATPQLVHAADFDFTRAHLFLHDAGARQYVYFRTDDAALHVAEVTGDTPRYLGVLSTLGDSGDDAFAFDPSGPSLYVFESESVSTGAFYRLD